MSSGDTEAVLLLVSLLFHNLLHYEERGRIVAGHVNGSMVVRPLPALSAAQGWEEY